MFSKITRGISHASGSKKGLKYKINILVEKLDNLPAPVKKCRVVWSRGPKVQMTETKDVVKGAVTFKQQLSQIATMYRDANDDFEPKEYKFQVQVPSKEGDGKLMTVGKADLDLSYFVLNEGQQQNKLIPIMFKVGAASTGYLKVVITAEPVSGEVDDDAMTEVSALTGMTAHQEDDQDLSGFDEDGEHESKLGGKPTPSAQSSTARRPGSRLSTAAASATTSAASTPEPRIEAKTQQTSKPDSKAASSSRGKPVVAATDDDGDISPMSMSPEDSPKTSPRESKAGSREAGKQSTVAARSAAAVSKADKNARSELFGTGPASKPQPAGRPANVRTTSNKTIPDLTEDEARSELFAAGASKHRATAPKASGNATKDRPNADSSSQSAAAAAAVPAASPISSLAGSRPSAIPRSPSARSDVSTSSAGGSGAANSAAAAPRRGLLNRNRVTKDKDLDAVAEAAASKQQQAAASRGTAGTAAVSKHSLSDDEDEPAAAPSEGGMLKPIATRTSAATSKIPNLTGSGVRAQDSPTAASATAGRFSTATAEADGAAVKQLSAENEKLKAQLAALRDQAAQAEDARRQARLAAENAASERDDYKAQVQELEQQLKEVITTSVGAEEAQELVQQAQALQQQVQDLQQQLHKQQQQPGQEQDVQERVALQQQQLTGSADLQHQCEQLHQALLQANNAIEQLQQQVKDSHSQNDGLQQQLQDARKEADEQYAQLQEQMHMQQDSMDQVKQLQQQLDDAMQLLDKQDAAIAAAGAAKGAGSDVPALSNLVVELRTKLAEQEQRVASALQQVHLTTQEECIKQYIWDNQLVEAAKQAIADAGLAPGGQLQQDLQQVLVCIKAATAAAVHQSEQEDQLKARIRDLSATSDAARADSLTGPDAHQLEQEQPGMSELKQQLAQLQAEASQLRADKQQLLQQQQQHSKLWVDKLGRKTADSVLETTAAPLIRADVLPWDGAAVSTKDSQEMHQHLSKVTQQLASSQRKVQQLTKARDKLEIILKEFETSAAEEKEQFLVQLSAANQQLRQLTQQLEHTQHKLAAATDRQQELEHSLQAAEVAVAAAELAAAEAREEQQLLQHALEEHEAAAHIAASPSASPAGARAMQVIALADNAAANSGLQEALSAAQEQVTDLQKQLAEADTSRKALDKELGRLRKQLTDEQAERGTLEEQLAQHLEDSGDYTAQARLDTVAAYEAKYNRLKTRFRELTASHRDEVAGLHDETAALQERVVDLEAAAAQLDAARSQAQHGEATLADALAKSSKASAELTALRTENQQLMQSLVGAKLELAQVSEREVISRRELYKAKETNMKLASKMTKLETLVYK